MLCFELLSNDFPFNLKDFIHSASTWEALNFWSSLKDYIDRYRILHLQFKKKNPKTLNIIELCLMGSSLLHTAFEILFAFNLWYLDYDGSWYAPLWVHSPWNCVLLLDLYVYFIHQVRDVFNPFLLLLAAL